jgi:thioredoxin reductase (NADPH)
MTTPARVRPAIVLVVAAEHIPVVDSEFGRYARDYDILCADDAAGGRELVRQAHEAR